MNSHPSLRVLMSADTIGGVWTYALDLARALQPFEVEVHLATMGSLPNREQTRQAVAISNLQLHQSSYQLEWMDDPWPDVDRAGAWLLRLEQRLKPDVVHLNHYAHGHLPWTAPTLTVVHSCVLSWWEAVKREPAPRQWQTYFLRVRRGLRASNAVVSVSRQQQQYAEQFYGPLAHHQVIANSRDYRLFSPAPKEPFVLGMGRLWDEAKNMEMLAGVARELPWPLVLAGEGAPEGQHFANVEFTGHLPHHKIADMLGAAAVYAMPACYEPFGLSVLEAGLSGCALVLADIPSLRENWDGAAIFVSPRHPADWKRALQKLAWNRSLRQEMAQRAIRRARSFSFRNFGHRYRQCYGQLLQRTGWQEAGFQHTSTRLSNF